MLRLRAGWWLWALAGVLVGSSVRAAAGRAGASGDVVRSAADLPGGEFVRSIATNTHLLEVRTRRDGGPDARSGLVCPPAAWSPVRAAHLLGPADAQGTVCSGQSRHYPRFPTGPPLRA